ncbi:MAG: TonB-dependent receptor [Gammaproteobacteria bacterium]|nr:TonB-dependent receptor [Gammaproteobacteria bacterium]
MELTWNPAAGFEVLLGASVLDAEVEDVGLPGGQIVDNSMPLAPDFTFNTIVRKAWLIGGSELAMQVDYNYTDSYYSDSLNTPSAEVDSHGVANARLSYGPDDGRWQVALNVRNLTDEDEMMFHIPTQLGFSEDAARRPRWASVQFIYRMN